MSDSTQLADQFLLQSSLKPDTSVKVSRGKSVAIVNDGQSGSYSSGIVSFDCASTLNGSQGYASLKDAYIVLPYVVSMKNTADTALSAGDYPTRYALGMKCNIASVIDEVKVYLNGKSIITPSEFKQIWSNVRAMAELTTAEAISQAIAQMHGTGGFKKGTSLTQGSTLGEWVYMLKIRLVDLHPIFNEIDLVANPQLKLELKVQTGYSDLTLIPSATTTARTMSLSSTTLVAGSICPVKIASSYSATTDTMNSVIGTAGCSNKLRVAWGPIHNSITTIATSGNYFPFTQSRLNRPFYDIANPTSIVSKPMKTIKYLDCYSQMFEDQAGIGAITSNKNFSIPYASPFDSAPWTFQPGSSILDFQVQVGNKDAFQDVHSYDWMTFLDEFSKLSAVNGDLSREISNGLIGMDKWQTAQRILVADCSRISEADVPQSIKISGTNIATQGTNLLVLVVYERSLELDRTTGEVYRAE
ncbi:unnamed protein product [Phytophthora fragariaefolia]|uniref:Unnamed protein product n=1 Tax=Phytophthora fragariaefolia TaxID=1490495 RepID=A0A9W6U7A4_9STRA|nr:unnamed protein product [Phytophthora fragariaefolia]